jgi:hypothetical protein
MRFFVDALSCSIGIDSVAPLFWRCCSAALVLLLLATAAVGDVNVSDFISVLFPRFSPRSEIL